MPLWRGDLSPIGGEAVVKPARQIDLKKCWGAASQPIGDKSPRHKVKQVFMNGL
jgi:hypothetical protein